MCGEGSVMLIAPWAKVYLSTFLQQWIPMWRPLSSMNKWVNLCRWITIVNPKWCVTICDLKLMLIKQFKCLRWKVPTAFTCCSHSWWSKSRLNCWNISEAGSEPTHLQWMIKGRSRLFVSFHFVLNAIFYGFVFCFCFLTSIIYTHCVLL